MERKDETTSGRICQECATLVGAHRHIEPHKNLVLIEYKPVSSMFGSADEHYYKCRNCDKSWLYESGSNGQGWVEYTLKMVNGR